MIYIERTLEFKRNDVKIKKGDSKAEEPIVLYKGDKNIELQFTIENNPFNYKSGVEITYGQLIIKRPNANPIFSDVAKFSNSKASFIITGEMIDDLNEIGEYDFQIRLLNADQTSRGTLPPVFAGIVIKEPVCEEDGVNFAAASYSRISLKSSETENTFDDEGNYNKTVWTKGDTITDTKLNKIEDAIYEINSDYVSDFDLDNKGYLTEHQDISYLASEQYVNDAISDIDIPTVPVNVSELNNDAGYLTEHQDVSHLALKSEIPTNVSGFINDINYASESYVDNATFGLRSEINLELENYASKEEIPSLEGLATENYVNEAISNIEISGGGGNADLSGFYTKEEMDALLKKKSDFPHYHDDRYYLKYQVDAKINNLQIGKYATLENLQAWAELLAPKTHEHENYATKDELNNAIGDINAILDKINGEEI